ncbi:hypothetical protein O181_085343 [Austropuccinia psidii MF-1]|uniref:Secreted protein n=1 Tax=Austropuccinia psidii MF-1 TaxID=1389203 RepID=A0A9Q3FSY5_9BASI|nr:hypothetical protein [Austropuccinia psidii MF-1]
MDCLRWHAIVYMSWFFALVQDTNASHSNPYDCAGFQYFKQLLTPGQAANASHTNHYTCTSSQQFKKLPMPEQAPYALHANPYFVEVPQNLEVSLRRCWLLIIHTRILTLVQVPKNSNSSLRRGGLPTIHMQILTLVQVPTMLKIPHACAGFQQFTHES